MERFSQESWSRLKTASRFEKAMVMPKELVYAFSTNMLIISWLRESGILESDCDLLTINETADFVARIEETGLFGKVFQTCGKSRTGRLYSLRQETIRFVHENPGRPYRLKSRYLGLLNPGRFFAGEKSDYEAMYVHHPFFTDNVLALYHHFAARSDFPLYIWEHGITICQIGSMRLFSCAHYNGSNSLWMGIHSIGHPSRYVRGFCVARPELLEESTRKTMRIRRVPPIDRKNAVFREKMNRLFSYTKEMHRPYDKRDCVFFPFPGVMEQGELRDIQDKVLTMTIDTLSRERVAIKPHPQSVNNVGEMDHLASFGCELALAKGIPFELCLLNIPELENRLIVSLYTSIACLTPKMFFNAEPYVILLDDLLTPTNLYADVSDLYKLQSQVRQLYERPEKLCLAKSWEEVACFLRLYREETGKGITYDI